MTTFPPFSIPVTPATHSGETPIFRSVISPQALVSSPAVGQVHTLFDVLEHSSKLYADKPLFGTRKIERMIEEEKEIVKQGKVEKKVWKYFQLSPYSWETYQQVFNRVSELSSGLANLGIKPGSKLIIFATTSADWLVMAHACFRQSITIATAYDTLGPEGLLHALNECEATALFTNAELIPVVQKAVLGQASHLKHVFYQGEPESPVASTLEGGVTVRSINDLRQLGAENPVDPVPPKASDIACIMYTSGSTGVPKGVIITHANMVAALGGVKEMLEFHLGDDDVILAYLPLAHVLEFAVENCVLFIGIRLGYGNPRTLTDASVRNCRGDLRELRPTLLVGVPAVWDTIRKGILTVVNGKSSMVQKVFHSAVKMKWHLMQNNLPSAWMNKIFDPVRAQTGGRLRFCLSGGAPISAEAQRFLSTVLCPVLQGYGMTESCGMCAILAPEMFQLSRVGANVPCIEIKLVDCAEAGYTVNDKPSPRGEIWIRGPAVSSGYFKQPTVTAEAFTSDGWLMTGDIGTIHDDGTISIIDRKKNLVKLSHGEYIALEKMESIYKAAHAVNNLCIIADSFHSRAVGLVQTVEREIKRIAQEMGLDTADYHGLCENPKVVEAVFAQMTTEAKRGGLKGAELIAKITLCPEEWTAENGLLTAAQKLKRKAVMELHAEAVNTMYNGL